MIKTYRGKISYFLIILFFPLLFTIAIILDGEASPYLFLIWIPFLLLILIPLGYKLEVGDNFIRNSFLGFSTMKLSSGDVQSINYGGIGLWGGVYPSRSITHGKGLAILASVNGISKTYGLSEKLYGKEAIEHVKRVLGSN